MQNDHAPIQPTAFGPVRLSDLKPGDRVKPINRKLGDCLAGAHRVVQRDSDGDLFVSCRDGQHLLDGHDYGEDGYLVGLARVK